MGNREFNQKMLKALGNFPKKPEPRFEVVGSEKKQGYTLQTVTYYVEKDEKIKAYLMLPDEMKEKNPAVLAIHQHNGEWHWGKSEVIGVVGNPTLSYGLDLCLRGYVVLAPDLLCFEERVDPEFLKKRGAADYEKFMFCKYILEGSCLQTKYLHDLSIAVDILESLTFVDQDRIGVIGHSLGGQEATWMMWYDERLKAGISTCGIGQLRTIIRDLVPHNFAMFVPGFLNLGEMSDLVSNIAPRSFLLTSGTEDEIFPIDGVRSMVETARKKYKALGIEEKFVALLFDGGHQFDGEEKTRAYAWLDEQLNLEKQSPASSAK